MGKFVVKQTEKGCHFSLLATNGQIIGSSEVYTTSKACLNGIKSVTVNAPEAEVEDQTVENFETKKNPKFEIYADKAEQFRFRLKAKNGQVILASQGYAKMESCVKGVQSVKKNAVNSEIVQE